MRRWLLVVPVVLWSSCAFDDSVPAESLIPCSGTAECPTGWKCSVLRSVCQQRDESDTVAPVLTGSVMPALVKPGQAITVEVQSDEPLSGQAVVEVSAGASLRPVEANDAGAYAFVVPAAEPDGLLTFYAKAEDRAGNGTQGVRLGTARVDGTAPAMTTVRVAPGRVAPGQAAIVTINLSEDVEAGAQLLVTTPTGAELLQLTSTAAASTLRFEVLVPAGTVDQTLSLRVVGLVDAAGNLGADAAAGNLEVDGSAPSIAALGLGGRRYSAQPGHAVVDVPVSVGAASSLSACLDQQCLPSTSGTPTRFTVTGQEAEGLHTVSVRASDEVGNVSQASDVVVFDFSPPALQPLSMTRPPTRAGVPVALEATFDEALAPGLVLVARQADGGLFFQSDAGVGGDRAATFSLPIPTGTPSQVLDLSLVGARDDVANASAPLPFGAVVVDRDAPVVASLGLQGRRYSLRAGHDHVVFQVSAAGASQITACLDQQCRAVLDGEIVDFAVTASWAEGSHTVSVRATDDARNDAQAADVVFFDYTAPRLQRALVAPPIIGPGGTVAVTATFDEELQNDTTLLVAADQGGLPMLLVAPSAGSRLAAFDVRLQHASFSSGTFRLTLKGAVDDVGNAALDLDAGFFVLDGAPPVFLDADGGYPRRYSHQPGYDVVAVPTPAVSGASVIQVCLEADCRAFDGGVVSFNVPGGATEGAHSLLFQAFDSVGNLASRFDTVTFDFSPPRVLSSRLSLTPPPGCPLPTVSALTRSTGVTLDVTTDQPVPAGLVLDSGVLALVGSAVDDGGTAFSYAATAPTSGLVDGVLDVSAVLSDDVGNTANAPLGQVRIDTIAPPTLTSVQRDQFVYNRNPYGSASSNFLPSFTIGSDAGVLEPNAQVQVWNALINGLLLGTYGVDSAGSLPLTALPPQDVPKLYFRPFDSACNASAGRKPVPRLEYTATMTGKVPGTSYPNPNRLLEDYTSVAGAQVPASTREFGGDDLASPDAGEATIVSPAVHWQTAGPTPGSVRCVWQDPIRSGVYVLTSARAYRLEPGGFIDEGVLPAPPSMNCATVNFYNAAPRMLAGTPAGYITFESTIFRQSSVGQLGTTDYYGGGVGWITSAPEGFFSYDPYSSSVWVTNHYVGYYAWSPLFVIAPPPSMAIGRQNFTHWGPGYPLVVGSQGGLDAYAFDVSGTGGYQWVKLEAAPEPVAAVQGYGAEVVLVGTSGRAWSLLNGLWQATAPCTLTSPVIASFESASGTAVMVGQDWTMVEFNGTKWAPFGSPPPAQLSRYRDAGFSPAVGALAPNGVDGGLLLHTALIDGGNDSTLIWNGSTWTVSAGVTPPSASAQVALNAAGTVIMLGQTPDAGMNTWAYVNGTWIPQGSIGPTERVDHRLVLDRNSQLVTLGGATVAPVPALLTGLASFSGSSWLNMGVPPWSPRSRVAAATDPLRGVTVMFGGLGNPGETWELSGAGWQRPVQPVSPSARSGAALTWDPVRRMLVLTSAVTEGDTWVYDGAWREVTRLLGAPPASNLAAWDGTSRAVVSLGAAGDAMLASTENPVAERFIVTFTPPANTTLLGGNLLASVSATGDLSWSTWTGSQWAPIAVVDAGRLALSPSFAQAVLADGVRLGPTTAAPVTFSTGYLEFVVRYSVDN